MSKSGDELKIAIGYIHEEEEICKKSKGGENGEGFTFGDMGDGGDQFGDGFDDRAEQDQPPIYQPMGEDWEEQWTQYMGLYKYLVGLFQDRVQKHYKKYLRQLTNMVDLSRIVANTDII